MLLPKSVISTCNVDDNINNMVEDKAKWGQHNVEYINSGFIQPPTNGQLPMCLLH